MASLTYFSVTADMLAVVGAAGTPSTVPIRGKVTFTPMINSGDALLLTTLSPRPGIVCPQPVTGIIGSDGQLGFGGSVGVRLIADTSVLGLSSPLFYTVSFTGLTVNGVARNLSQFNFQASQSDTPINLVTVARVPGQPASGIVNTRSPDHVRLNGSNQVVFSANGVDLPDPLPIEGFDADLSDIAALAPSNDDVVQRKAGHWTNRTPAQLKTDLALTKSDVGLGSADNVSEATVLSAAASAAAAASKSADTITDGTTNKVLSAADKTRLAGTSGTNTGDQTSVSGNAGSATVLATARNLDGQSFNGSADITVIAPGTHAASSKTTPVDADELPLVDSAASNVLKKLTWASLKATLKTYFDSLTTTLTNKTLTSPVINSPTGITPSDVAPASSVAISTNTAPTANQITIYDATSGALAVALPALAGLTSGSVYPVQRYQLDVSANALNFNPNGGDTFDSGATTFSLPLPGELRYFQVVTVSAVKKWKVVGGNTTVGSQDTRYLGTIPAGTKGGKYPVIRRRDLPHRPDQLWPSGGVVETVTTNSAVSVITGKVGYPLPQPAALVASGGQTLHADGSASDSYKFDWRYNDAGGYPTVLSYPNPRGWSIQFAELGGAEIEFCVYAHANYAWNLMIDGYWVWDVPRTTALSTNHYNMIKFALPDAGVHDIRFFMNGLSLQQVYASAGTTLWPRPLRGPRVAFVGDSLTQSGGQSTGDEIGSWIQRFSHMCGFEDVWNAGIGGTGPLATNGNRGPFTDGVMTSGSNVLTSASAAFIPSDVTQPITVAGAGVAGATLTTTIASRTNATTVVLAANASTTVSGATFSILGLAANYQTRATTDVVPSGADIVFITSYYNDRNSYTAATIVAALAATIDTIRAGLPNAMIVMISSWDPLGVNGTPYTTIDALLKTACAARGVPLIQPITGSVFDGAGNTVVDGTTTAAPWFTSANIAALVGGDNVHPTDAGQKYLAYRIYNAFRSLLPA